MPVQSELFISPTISSLPLPGNTSNHKSEEMIDILSVYQKVSLAAPYFLVEPIALVLNFLILFILRQLELRARNLNARNGQQAIGRPHLRTFYFLRHLVFSDLLTCFVALPFDALEIYRLEFRRSDPYCVASKYVRFVALSTSFYILVVTSFERLWSLMFPLRPLSRNKVVYMTRGAWLAAFIINIPSLFLYRTKIEFVDDDDHYFVRVCAAEEGILGTFVRAHFGVTFLIPAIAISVLTTVMFSCIWKMSKKVAVKRSSQVGETSASEISDDVRSLAMLAATIAAGFWLCSSPAGFYYLVIAGTGRPKFPSSYLIERSMVIIANTSAAVNPVITILFYPPIKEKARYYLGLGTKRSYNMEQNNHRSSSNRVDLLNVKVRLSLQSVGCNLKNVSNEQKKEIKEGNRKCDGPDKDTSVTTNHEETTETSVPQ